MATNKVLKGSTLIVLCCLFCSFMSPEDMLKASLAMLIHFLLVLRAGYTALEMSLQLARKVTWNFLKLPP